MDCVVHEILQARILEWVAFPFSKGSFQPRDRTQVSCIAGIVYTSWATREAQECWTGFSSVQSLSHVQLFGTPWTAGCQASLSITNSQSLLKLMCITSVISSHHLILCHPTISSSVIPFSSCLQSLPASRSLPMSQFFVSGGQSIGVAALAPVLPMNIQDWFHKGSPRILEWIAYHFSRQSSRPRNRTRVSGIAGGFFTNWAIRDWSLKLVNFPS